jgi:hypothetical protein
MLHCFLSLPSLSKRTTPSIFANSVSSSPMPQFVPGWIFGAALTDEDVARKHELTVRALYAQTLRRAVAAVARAAHSFFVGEQLKIHLKHACYLRSL